MNKITYIILNVKKLLECLISGQLFTVINWWDVVYEFLGINRKKDIRIKFKNGLIVLLRSGSLDFWSIHEIFFRNEYKLFKDMNNDHIIFDLGANAGIFSLFAHSRGFQHIVAYEPDRRNYLQIKKNISVNKLEKNIKVKLLACTKDAGKIKLFLENDNRSYSVINENKDEKKYEYAKSTTLSNIIYECPSNAKVIVKMDIEGSEYDVLYSTPVNVIQRVSYFTMEYHNLSSNSQHNGNSLKKYFEKIGFFTTIKESPLKDVGMLYANKIYK